ncbi:hypothetical protein HYFRA_00009581 [Hymenoscyphus fraxineus]|uniref:Holocytochrome c-type synthase n=1 Tax=Hymenoscyphus fraxineus TaxID=746836 RepID=A0A9N9PVI4_9HELO|nr:hypothetical protein HYFRA_00009581 [Hymenoscyphus fraxineus]
MAKEEEKPSAEACPVDHTTRAAWLKANPGTAHPFSGASKPPSPSNHPTTPPSKSIFSRLWASTPSPPPPADSQGLALDREISTIPRASVVNDSDKPANNEKEGGVSTSGNWIYPSEKMFFEAMKRKGYASDASDMKTIVPIHNAVNERAWKEIKEWERPYGSEQKCGGPKLHSFAGLSQTLSPKARFNTLLGYTAPFDRHDWVIDRCGTRVDYIIDFYAGKNEGRDNGKLNFFLDVRPKLNTFEGWKMRGLKFLGMV